MSLKPLPAGTALEAYYLEARSKILDLAAILDRIDRGDTQAELSTHKRDLLVRGIQLLLETTDADRAEAVQMLFSLPYESGWTVPKPRLATT
jgi:hypothetical protein